VHARGFGRSEVRTRLAGELVRVPPRNTKGPRFLYKRDISAGQPLSNTLDGCHQRMYLTAWPEAARNVGVGAGAGHAADRPGRHARRWDRVVGQLGVRAQQDPGLTRSQGLDRRRRRGRRRDRPDRNTNLSAPGQVGRGAAAVIKLRGSAELDVHAPDAR